MKKALHIFKAVLYMLVLVSFLIGCGGGSDGTHLKKWTIIMYWDGDDVNIQSDLIEAFQEMVNARVGSTEQVNVVIQFDRYPGNPAYGGWPITHRFFLTPGMEPTEANAIPDWGDGQGGGREVDMSDPNTLRDFITWAVKNYPAERYALIVADHGFGWQGIIIDNTNYQRTMSLKQLRQAIEESQVHFDLLGLDACTMQMIEVAHELRNSNVDILVGSEDDGTTWPFAEILQAIMLNPGMSAEEIGRTIVDRYNSSHPLEKNITLSVLKLCNVEALTASMKELSLAILTDAPLQVVQEKAKAVMERISNAVVYVKNCPDWESARGVSVYFPMAGPMITIPPELQYFYKSQIVSFAGEALWHDVLTSCYLMNPLSNIPMILHVRNDMKTFDDDKVDLYDLCNRIVNYSTLLP